MFHKDYTYAVARIRSKELSLFNTATMEQLVSTKSYDEALRFLIEKGWGNGIETHDAEKLLSDELENTWALMKELVDDLAELNVLRIVDDFHNLKAAIKLIYSQSKLPLNRVFLNNGRLAAENIYKTVKSKDFLALPGRMASAGQQAYDALVSTGDSQLCDMLLDRAALEDLLDAAKTSHSDVLIEYAILTTVAADIKIAVRCGQTGKSLDFVRRALAPCPTLNIDLLSHAAVSGTVTDYLAQTEYADAVGALQDSPAAFERWCDNLVIRHLQPQKYDSFTIGPIAAFLLAKQNEIKCARMVLSGKLNNLPDSIIRERMREMYV